MTRGRHREQWHLDAENPTFVHRGGHRKENVFRNRCLLCCRYEIRTFFLVGDTIQGQCHFCQHRHPLAKAPVGLGLLVEDPWDFGTADRYPTLK